MNKSMSFDIVMETESDFWTGVAKISNEAVKDILFASFDNNNLRIEKDKILISDDGGKNWKEVGHIDYIADEAVATAWVADIDQLGEEED